MNIVYFGFMMPEVKVPVCFSGTEVFPARRDARSTVVRQQINSHDQGGVIGGDTSICSSLHLDRSSWLCRRADEGMPAWRQRGPLWRALLQRHGPIWSLITLFSLLIQRQF